MIAKEIAELRERVIEEMAQMCEARARSLSLPSYAGERAELLRMAEAFRALKGA